MTTEVVQEVLEKSVSHYQACMGLGDLHESQRISRAASRFIKTEKSMIRDINVKIGIECPQLPCSDKIKNYSSMYAYNSRLISFIKSKIKQNLDIKVITLLSYWVAALQIENDEMAKYL
ncbi:hypothetical protein [Marinomonas sp.]